VFGGRLATPVLIDGEVYPSRRITEASLWITLDQLLLNHRRHFPSPYIGAGERDELNLDQHPALASCLRVILPETGFHPGSGRGSRIRRLEHAATDLIFLDRDKQRPEIAFAEAFVALALDELEKDWADQVGRENLQQNLASTN
jgi:hypothetical protein